MALLSDLPLRAKCTKLEFRITQFKDGFRYQCDFLGTKDIRMHDDVENIELFVRQFLRKFDGFKLDIDGNEFSFYVKNISLKKIPTGADRKANAYKAVARRQYWNRVMS